MYISTAQRRARLVLRHHLDRSARDVTDAAASVVGLHSSDPATVYLSARARVAGVRREDLEAALYDERTLIRILGMRRTMFVVPTSTVAEIHNSSTRALVAGERRRTIRMVVAAGLTQDGDRWVDAACDATLEALRRKGEAVATELTREVPQLREKYVAHKADGSVFGTIGMSTRVLFLLATEGRIVRGRPRGSWLSSQYRWVPMEQWLGSPIAAIPAANARSAVLARYLGAFGPVTETDARWWTGWPLGQVRTALAAIGAIPVDIDSGSAFVLADDLDFEAKQRPSVSLLPSLDPTTMGWKERDWYLGPHAGSLFDRSGNAGATIWVDGRIVGGWAVRPSGQVAWRLLEDVPRRRQSAIERAVRDLEDWLDGTVVVARFRSQLDRELSGS